MQLLKSLLGYLLSLGLLLAICQSSFAQMKYNQHNPYVSNADVFKLRKLGIDLFDKPIEDESFQKNVVELVLNKNSFDKYKAARYGIVGVGTAGLAVLIAGMVVGERRSITTFGLKNDYLNFGAVTTAASVIAYSINVANFKKSKSKYLQQLEITRGQYDVLMPN